MKIRVIKSGENQMSGAYKLLMEFRGSRITLTQMPEKTLGRGDIWSGPEEWVRFGHKEINIKS